MDEEILLNLKAIRDYLIELREKDENQYAGSTIQIIRIEKIAEDLNLKLEE